MKTTTKFDIHEASEWYGEDLFIADGLDNAIIGIAEVDGVVRVCYSRTKVIECYMEQGMTELEAVEFAEYNTFNAYLGSKTPLWVDDFFMFES